MPIFIEISTRSKKRLIPSPPQPGPGYETYSGLLYWLKTSRFKAAMDFQKGGETMQKRTC